MYAQVLRPSCGGAVLAPQQHQRHALAAQLDVHPGVVGLDHAAECRAAAHQPAFERCLVELGRRCPVEPGAAGQAEVLGDGALGDRQALRDALVRQAALVLESEYVLDHAYVHALILDWLCREPQTLAIFNRTESAEGDLDALLVVPADV